MMRAPAGILAFLAACVMASPGARAASTRIVVKVKTPAKVYYEPVSSARIVDQLTLGVPVTVVEERGDWVRVQTGSGEGWIERTYVDLPGPGGMTTTRLVKVKSPASVHYEPVMTSRIVENLATGHVTLVEDRGEWIRVRTASGDGWIQRAYVDLSDAGSTTITRYVTVKSPTAVFVEPAMTAPVIESVVMGAPLTLVEDRGEWIRVRTTRGDGWIQKTYVDLSAPGEPTTLRYVTLKSPSTLLVEPAPTSRVVETVTMSAPVTVLEDRGEWMRVQTTRGDGWVQRTYVDVPGPDGTTRIVTVKTPATLLLEPTAYSRAVKELSLGTPVTLVEDRGEWVRVQSSMGEGWLQRTHVDLPEGAVVTTRVVKLRSPTVMVVEPTSTARVLESLRSGAPLTLVEERGDWIRVKTSSGEGWIQRTYVDLP